MRKSSPTDVPPPAAGPPAGATPATGLASETAAAAWPGWAAPSQPLAFAPRAIFFDMGHTLMIEEPSAETLFNQACQDQGLPADIRRFSRRYDLLAAAVETYRHGYIGEYEYFNLVVRPVLESELQRPVSERELLEVWRQLRTLQRTARRLTAVAPHTVRILQRFHASGYRLGTISNWGSSFFSIIEVYQLGSLFDVALASEMVGISKPNPEIFLKAARMLRLEPDQVLFVGDNYHYDGAGARNAGMHAIHFNVGLLHQARMALSELKRGIRGELLPPPQVPCIDDLDELAAALLPAA